MSTDSPRSAEEIAADLEKLIQDARFAAAEGGCEMIALNTPYGQFIEAHGPMLLALLRSPLGGQETQAGTLTHDERQALEELTGACDGGFEPYWEKRVRLLIETVYRLSSRVSSVVPPAAETKLLNDWREQDAALQRIWGALGIDSHGGPRDAAHIAELVERALSSAPAASETAACPTCRAPDPDLRPFTASGSGHVAICHDPFHRHSPPVAGAASETATEPCQRDENGDGCCCPECCAYCADAAQKKAAPVAGETPAATTPPMRLAWVLEGQVDGHPAYWDGGHAESYTRDVSKAAQFARWMDAATVCPGRHYHQWGWRYVEHAFVGDVPSPVPSVGASARPRFVCPDCGVTSVDEDGCCRSCGADTNVGKASVGASAETLPTFVGLHDPLGLSEHLADTNVEREMYHQLIAQIRHALGDEARDTLLMDLPALVARRIQPGASAETLRALAERWSEARGYAGSNGAIWAASAVRECGRELLAALDAAPAPEPVDLMAALKESLRRAEAADAAPASAPAQPQDETPRAAIAEELSPKCPTCSRPDDVWLIADAAHAEAPQDVWECSACARSFTVGAIAAEVDRTRVEEAGE